MRGVSWGVELAYVCNGREVFFKVYSFNNREIVRTVCSGNASEHKRRREVFLMHGTAQAAMRV